MKRTIIAMAVKVMRCEERNVFLGDLVRLHLGTKEVEGFVRKQERLRREKEGVRGEYEDDISMSERERDMVGIAMENKLTSSLADGVKKTQELIALKNRLWWRIKKEEERRKFRNKLREVVERQRDEIKIDHKKQVRTIRMESKKEWVMNLPPELKRYKDAKIFGKDATNVCKPEEMIGPFTVGTCWTEIRSQS